jgi:hypothetical protein
MWDNLWTALVSGSLVLAGVIFTQRRADQREDKRLDRDDAARSYDHRRDAYMTYRFGAFSPAIFGVTVMPLICR